MNDGVRAIVQGLKDGGVQAVYNFPGFYSHDIAAALGDPRIALNERVAFAEGFGASLAGKRTLVTFKNVGLNVASDAFLHAVIAGVRAGLVLVVTDDVAVWGSQESQDSRHYFDFYGGLWLEPKDLQQAYDYASEAFTLSERFDTPVVIRLANSFFKLEGSFMSKQMSPILDSLDPVRSEKFIVHPYFYKKQEINLRNKNTAAAIWAEEVTELPIAQKRHGVIVAGAVHDRIPDDVDVLVITTLPLPINKIRSFAASHKFLTVLEDGDEYIADRIRSLVSTRIISTRAQGERGVAAKFTKWARHAKFFKALAEVKQDSLVVGEIAQFTVETYDAVDAALSLGTAVSTAIGHAEASKRFTYCLSGDCSFLHEGIGIIEEAVRRDVKLGIIIFDNHASWCTGGQPPLGDITQIPDNIKIRKFHLDYDTMSHQKISATLKEMQQFEGLSILHLKVPLGNLSRDED